MHLSTRGVLNPDEPPPPTEERFVDITTGEVIDLSNADHLIDLYNRVDETYRNLREFRQRLALKIAERTEADTKTRRLRGEKRIAVVEMPDDAWDQSILKEAWNAYPNHRDEFLAIASIRVKLREWKKLEGTTCPPSLESFRTMVARANRGPAGTPSIKVEA